MALRKQHEIAGGRANERLAWTMGKGSDWQKWTGLYFYSEMDTKVKINCVFVFALRDVGQALLGEGKKL